MFAVSDALTAVLRGSHAPCSRVVCLDAAGTVLASFEGRAGILTAGTASYDRARTVRRTANVTLANADGALSPTAAGDLFATGSRVRVDRGGEGVYLPLVEGFVTGYRASMNGTLEVTLEDPLSLLSQPCGAAIAIAAGTRAEDVLVTLWGPLLDPVYPVSTWDLDGGGQTTGDVVLTEDDDLLSAVASVMDTLGLEVFASRWGTPVLRPRPDYTTVEPVRSFTTDRGSGTLLELDRRGERIPFNRVVVISDNIDGPVFRAELEVTDPLSPIHKSRIGVRTAPVYRAPNSPDQAAVNLVARVLLIEHSLYQDSVGVSAAPDVTLDESDVVDVIETVTGTADRYVLGRVDHSVVDGALSLSLTRVVPVWLLV